MKLFSFGGQKTVTIPEEQWREQQHRLEALSREIGDMRRRWRLVFPIEPLDLEEGALGGDVLATIQERLGVEQLIEQARVSLEAEANKALAAARDEIATLPPLFSLKVEEARTNAEAQLATMQATLVTAKAQVEQLKETFPARIEAAHKDIDATLEASLEKAKMQLREHIASLLQNALTDPQWEAVVTRAVSDIDPGEVELKMARMLSERIRPQRDLPALTKTIAVALVENGILDLRWLQEEVAGELAEQLAPQIFTWMKQNIDLARIASETAKELIARGELDTRWFEERVAEGIVERLAPVIIQRLKGGRT